MEKNKESADLFGRILKVTEEIGYIKDLELLLDRILTEARNFTSADAGSIYLVEENNLKFCYVQNTSLSKKRADGYQYLCENSKLNITESSIVGYVALTGRSVKVEDAYRIPGNLPYAFNPSFDRQTFYHTQSILTVPLKTSREIIVGVLQVINKIGDKNQVIVFSEEDIWCVEHFALRAAAAIERAQMTREMVLRMIRMAELRDPSETGPHIDRVAAYAVEIYQRWANGHQISEDKIKEFKDNLKIAAMFHDVGKVGISDAILKKPGKLTEPEFDTMKLHTLFGARLFQSPTSDPGPISSEVCLSHHERWDGTGYPDKIKENQIPLSARIVALADVYDALSSKRAYKDAWKEEEVLRYIQEQKGKQFDPEVVDSFLAIYSAIQSIQKRFQDQST